jgi:hypothetical protein
MRLISKSSLGLLLVLSLGGVLALNQASFSDVRTVDLETLTFEGSRAEAERFMAYHRSIHLTPEQEAVKRKALEAIPAPCCSNFSAATCCCECNLTRTIWGLSNFLIAEKGFGAGQVREAVNAWIQAVNPSGFTGDACYKGSCGRSFKEGGCGGMREEELIFE